MKAQCALVVVTLALFAACTVATHPSDRKNSLRVKLVHTGKQYADKGTEHASSDGEEEHDKSSPGELQKGESNELDEVRNTVEDTFSTIYKHRLWTDVGGGSGPGSQPLVARVAQAIIRTVANKYNLHSLMDAPCGGMEWQQLLLLQLEEDFEDFRFMGVDVVSSVIQGHKRNFSGHPNWKFMSMDLSKGQLRTGYDLVLSRDALQHLPCELVVLALKNLASSGAQYYLLGSYEDAKVNYNIEVGHYYDINLRLPPFNMGDGVVHSYGEHTSLMIDEPDKYLLLFTGEYLASLDFDAMQKGCAKLGPKPTSS